MPHRLGDYAANPNMPPFLWLRFLTIQRLQALHRLHLGVQGRDASREVSIFHGSLPAADSGATLAAQLLGRLTTPSRAAIRAEIQLKIQEALDAMDPIDCEILALRHFEELNNSETAEVLGIHKAAASNRYVRAKAAQGAAIAGARRFRDSPADQRSVATEGEMMTGSTADRNPIERLAEEFAERLRLGEYPAIADYIMRHPGHADDIRDLFPEIVAVEQCKLSDAGSRTPSGTAMPAQAGPPPRPIGRLPHPSLSWRRGGWAWSTRPCESRFGTTSRSRSCIPSSAIASVTRAGSALRRGRRPGCITPTS